MEWHLLRKDNIELHRVVFIDPANNEGVYVVEIDEDGTFGNSGYILLADATLLYRAETSKPETTS